MPRSSLKVLPLPLYFHGKRPLRLVCAMVGALGPREQSKVQLVSVQHLSSNIYSWLMAAANTSFVSGLGRVFLCMEERFAYGDVVD